MAKWRGSAGFRFLDGLLRFPEQSFGFLVTGEDKDVVSGFGSWILPVGLCNLPVADFFFRALAWAWICLSSTSPSSLGMYKGQKGGTRAVYFDDRPRLVHLFLRFHMVLIDTGLENFCQVFLFLCLLVAVHPTIYLSPNTFRS